LVFQNLWEEAGWQKNDLDALSRIAWYLDDMRGNDVPRDLFVRIRGGGASESPWEIDFYGEASAVHSEHRKEYDGIIRTVTDGDEQRFFLVPIRECD
jgi:hypothetical protein